MPNWLCYTLRVIGFDIHGRGIGFKMTYSYIWVNALQHEPGPVLKSHVQVGKSFKRASVRKPYLNFAVNEHHELFLLSLQGYNQPAPIWIGRRDRFLVMQILATECNNMRFPKRKRFPPAGRVKQVTRKGCAPTCTSLITALGHLPR